MSMKETIEKFGGKLYTNIGLAQNKSYLYKRNRYFEHGFLIGNDNHRHMLITHKIYVSNFGHCSIFYCRACQQENHG